ncbi:MAG: tripartite tricarboxylate transporter TctB family protein [Spirochaetales bacterium]|jgi:putative tricarboxylic transport membrane protein|nr:tripartite tricarboxylate transporter TctB family protein [Spirochaetales bacterium]
MMKVKFLKSVNDFIIGVVLLGVGIFFTTYKEIVKGPVSDSVGGILVRPDVYVRMVGVLLVICSLIMVLKSINYRRSDKTEGFHFVLTREVALTGISLLLYAALLEPVGFFISTFLLTLFLTCMYMRRERGGEGKPPLTRKAVLIAAVYSILMVIVVHLIFAKVLNVFLPAGDIFS